MLFLIRAEREEEGKQNMVIVEKLKYHFKNMSNIKKVQTLRFSSYTVSPHICIHI